ncbi:hypothetical protein NPIL_7571 [Nephila pilipes]|uniref:Uncharacterized protein n=1 Tax=Nephila pilipes TaxID=299642 RepID=A0A8X6P9F8_NEPPI|nr:hypothetical protein NPIL_7571 [Nephila pilipes]
MTGEKEVINKAKLDSECYPNVILRKRYHRAKKFHQSDTIEHYVEKVLSLSMLSPKADIFLFASACLSESFKQHYAKVYFYDGFKYVFQGSKSPIHSSVWFSNKSLLPATNFCATLSEKTAPARDSRKTIPVRDVCRNQVRNQILLLMRIEGEGKIENKEKSSSSSGGEVLPCFFQGAGERERKQNMSPPKFRRFSPLDMPQTILARPCARAKISGLRSRGGPLP